MIAGLISAAVLVLTPVIVSVFALFSPPPALEYGETLESLRQRNALISNVAQALGFLGIVSPLVLFKQGINQVGWPALGLAFGLMVILPAVWVCIATLPLGIERFKEFWRFTEIHQKCGLGATLVIYVPLAAWGLVSMAVLWNQGDKVLAIIKSAW